MPRIGKYREAESRSVVAQGWWGWRETAKGCGISFGDDEYFLKLTVVMDVQLVVHSKWVNHITYKLYLNKPVKNVNRGLAVAELKRENDPQRKTKYTYPIYAHRQNAGHKCVLFSLSSMFKNLLKQLVKCKGQEVSHSGKNLYICIFFNKEKKGQYQHNLE